MMRYTGISEEIYFILNDDGDGDGTTKIMKNKERIHVKSVQAESSKH